MIIPALQVLWLGDVTHLEQRPGIPQLRFQSSTLGFTVDERQLRTLLSGHKLLLIAFWNGGSSEVLDDLSLVHVEEGRALFALHPLPATIIVGSCPLLVPVKVERASAAMTAQKTGERVHADPRMDRQRCRNTECSGLLSAQEQPIIGMRVVGS